MCPADVSHNQRVGQDGVATFLEYKGYTSNSTEVSHVTNVVAALHYSALTIKPGRQHWMTFSINSVV